jgi:hypothetical protein
MMCLGTRQQGTAAIGQIGLLLHYTPTTSFHNYTQYPAAPRDILNLTSNAISLGTLTVSSLILGAEASCIRKS